MIGLIEPFFLSPRSHSNSFSGLPMVAVVAKVGGVPLDMSRIHPEYSDSDRPDRRVVSDVLLRQEPDEEEEDDEEEDNGNGKGDDEDDDNDDGYSE
jgi:hypothetical protein